MEEEMPHQTYLQKCANGDYCYRRTVPVDIRDHVGVGSEYERSLKTKDSAVAKARWEIVNAEVERLFAKYRKIHPAKVVLEARAVEAPANEAVVDLGTSDTPQFSYVDGDTSPEERKMLKAAGQRVAFAQIKIDDFERMLVVNDYPFLNLPEAMLSPEEERMIGNLKSMGFDGNAPVSIVRAFVQAELKALKYIHGRNRGVVGETSPRVGGREVLLSVAADKWAEEKQVLKQWKPKTAAMFRSAVRLFIQIVGDKDLFDYRKEDVLEFKTTLLKLPPNIGNNRRLKGLPIEQVLALGLSPMATSNARKIYMFVGSFFRYAVDACGILEQNPFAGQTIGKSKDG